MPYQQEKSFRKVSCCRTIHDRYFRLNGTRLHLSKSKEGVLQPILVRMGADGVFIIVSGKRRFQASKNAGLATIPAMTHTGALRMHFS